ncbi:MAG: hypothetical protein K0S45_3606 [Nitrospira sp.]|nr:hypothetical protein [Nitrospira sp.]
MGVMPEESLLAAMEKYPAEGADVRSLKGNGNRPKREEGRPHADSTIYIFRRPLRGGG